MVALLIPTRHAILVISVPSKPQINYIYEFRLHYFSPLNRCTLTEVAVINKRVAVATYFLKY